MDIYKMIFERHVLVAMIYALNEEIHFDWAQRENGRKFSCCLKDVYALFVMGYHRKMIDEGKV